MVTTIPSWRDGGKSHATAPWHRDNKLRKNPALHPSAHKAAPAFCAPDGMSLAKPTDGANAFALRSCEERFL